ncbi:MAG: amidohydrolase family protein [Desulfovibrio sp.]|uniref:amidohydrolase family protein n=1 Tax=Desulfovibrio sp. TaxID=885 RepID=UPI00135D5B2D|nr:amidohydrolase family protein [Desulfovibrio sp.]MTJ91612.1 amidohydrolase family protein [Desulfovibrio sp.]
MYIDIHTHAFHPKIAHKAVDHLNSFYSLTCSGDGTIANLLEREKEARLEKCVVLCAATAPAQVIPANSYAISLQREHPDQVIAFGTVHPGYENWEGELARLKAAGIRGIKLHPDFQSFWLDDPRLLPIFEAAQNDFVFEIHIGDRTTPDKNPSCPYKLASILRQFPGIRVIAAHFGGYRMWNHALEVFAGNHFENLWFDTSSTTPFATPELAHKLLNAFPRERILFGTDWPLYDPVEELARLQALGGLSDSEMEVIMSNASALLALNNEQGKSQHDH